MDMKEGHKVLASHTYIDVSYAARTTLMERMTACVCAVRMVRHAGAPTPQQKSYPHWDASRCKAAYINHRHLLLHYLTMRRSAALPTMCALVPRHSFPLRDAPQ